MSDEQQKILTETVRKEQGRLLGFIKNRVPTPEDAEDILQDVFFQLADAYRLMKPIEQASAWLFTVARNKITDWYRKNRPESLESQLVARSNDDEEAMSMADILPDLGEGPDRIYDNTVLWEAIEVALDELPEEQRLAFVLHEFEGRSFKDISDETGLSVNTWISRKRYAVVYLRGRLEEIYLDMFNN